MVRFSQVLLAQRAIYVLFERVCTSRMAATDEDCDVGEMFLAAMLVGASRTQEFLEALHQCCKDFKRKDLPVPPGPVIKKQRP
jgi:hypothetical protein